MSFSLFQTKIDIYTHILTSIYLNICMLYKRFQNQWAVLSIYDYVCVVRLCLFIQTVDKSIWALPIPPIHLTQNNNSSNIHLKAKSCPTSTIIWSTKTVRYGIYSSNFWITFWSIFIKSTRFKHRIQKFVHKSTIIDIAIVFGKKLI